LFEICIILHKNIVACSLFEYWGYT